jgi:hypothetical protein
MGIEGSFPVAKLVTYPHLVKTGAMSPLSHSLHDVGTGTTSSLPLYPEFHNNNVVIQK